MSTISCFSHLQQLSESIRVPREWGDGEWLSTFSNSTVLFSLYWWEAEAKGTWVTLGHTTGPEVTSDFLNTIPKAQEGALGFFTFLILTKNFSTTTQIREDIFTYSYSHLQPTSLQGIFYYHLHSLVAKMLSASVLVPCRATAKSCSTAKQRLYGQDNCYFHQFFSKASDCKSYSWLACLCNTSHQENLAHTIGCGPH